MAKKLKILQKFKKENIQYYEQKKRLLIVVLVMFLLIVLAVKLFQIAYASYESTVKLNANINKALYIIQEGDMDFNIDLNKIEPSNEPYIYKFSVSNFDGNKHSQVDLEYQIDLRTTTNLPLTYKLYRNENYDDSNATNLFENVQIVQDTDGAWYNLAEGKEKYEFLYTETKTDIYTLVINFPKEYKNKLDYADNLDNIEIEIKSNQITD